MQSPLRSSAQQLLERPVPNRPFSVNPTIEKHMMNNRCLTLALGFYAACSFVMAEDRPHWSKSEPFGHNVPRDLKTDTLDDVRDQLSTAGLSVERGPTRVLVRQEEIGNGSFTGSIVKYPDGHLLVNARTVQIRSGDGGQTWKRVKSKFDNYTCRTRDGQTLGFTGVRQGREPTDRTDTIKIKAELIRSRDSGNTETSEMATIYLPAALKRITLRHARIVQLADGTLLACSYVSFQEDPWVTFPSWVTKTGIIHAKTFQKNRVIVIHSTDDGKTWNYRSTVAFDITAHVEQRILGYSEPDMVALQTGAVLVFMRTVAGGGVRPMYMSMSRDGGHTWSNADPVTDRGVSPCVVEMQNGVIVVVYGRPGNWLMFSADRGQTWTGHFQFFMGEKSWDAWNQCSVEEVAPDTLLVTYRRTDPAATPGTPEATRGDMLGTYFTVKRVGEGPKTAKPPTLTPPSLPRFAIDRTGVLDRDVAVHRRRRVILNDDAGMVFDKIANPADFVSKIATTVDTNVDSIWLSSMVGADLYVYDCKVGQRVGESPYPGHETMKGEAEGFKQQQANMKVMLDAGTDPLREVIRFGHRHGKEVFASFRMNMVQDSWRPNFQTQWKREHPDWCLGVREMAQLKNDARSIYWSALNFELPEVRDQRVAVIEDICTRYNVDGLELDWWRWPMFFKPTMDGKPVEAHHVQIMNDFLRRVRRKMNEIEAWRKRPLLLAARVFDNEEISLRLGLDARTWIEEGLIDILVVGGTYSYYSIETEKWVAMAKSRNIPVYVCLYRPRGIERDRARTAYHMSRGAEGMYLFNWLRSPDKEKPSLQELGDMNIIADKDKHYVMSGPFKTLGFRHILPEHRVPVRLEHGEWRSAKLLVGDDLKTARATGKLVETTLHLKLGNLTPNKDRLKVKLNGTPLNDPKWDESNVSFNVSSVPLALHENSVVVYLERIEPNAKNPVELVGLELWVRYAKSGPKTAARP